MAFAIGMHNAPRASRLLRRCMPTRSRERAFVVAAATGLVEPLAAGLSAAVLSPSCRRRWELALLGVAGAMIAVSLLGPSRRRGARRRGPQL